jgi:transposase InsO family protein
LITFTFRKASDERKPNPGLIFHSDRGTQYTSFAFEKLLQKQQAVQSFSRSGKPHDNAVMESFFAYFKKEELYRRRYNSEKEFLGGIDNYIAFYNGRRPHGALHYKTPRQPQKLFITGSETKLYPDKWVRIA